MATIEQVAQDNHGGPGRLMRELSQMQQEVQRSSREQVSPAAPGAGLNLRRLMQGRGSVETVRLCDQIVLLVLKFRTFHKKKVFVKDTLLKCPQDTLLKCLKFTKLKLVFERKMAVLQHKILSSPKVLC